LEDRLDIRELSGSARRRMVGLDIDPPLLLARYLLFVFDSLDDP
jgi:hypothetical protein